MHTLLLKVRADVADTVRASVSLLSTWSDSEGRYREVTVEQMFFSDRAECRLLENCVKPWPAPEFESVSIWHIQYYKSDIMRLAALHARTPVVVVVERCLSGYKCWTEEEGYGCCTKRLLQIVNARDDLPTSWLSPWSDLNCLQMKNWKTGTVEDDCGDVEGDEHGKGLHRLEEHGNGSRNRTVDHLELPSNEMWCICAARLCMVQTLREGVQWRRA